MWLRNFVGAFILDEELTRYVTTTPQKRIRPLNHSESIENFDCLSLGVSNDRAIELLINAGNADCYEKRAALLMCRHNALNHSFGIWVRLIT